MLSFTYEQALIYQIDFMSADSPSLTNCYHLPLFSGKLLKNDAWVYWGKHKMKDVFFANLLYSEARWQYC